MSQPSVTSAPLYLRLHPEHTQSHPPQRAPWRPVEATFRLSLSPPCLQEVPADPTLSQDSRDPPAESPPTTTVPSPPSPHCEVLSCFLPLSPQLTVSPLRTASCSPMYSMYSPPVGSVGLRVSQQRLKEALNQSRHILHPRGQPGTLSDISGSPRLVCPILTLCRSQLTLGRDY